MAKTFSFVKLARGVSSFTKGAAIKRQICLLGDQGLHACLAIRETFYLKPSAEALAECTVLVHLAM